MTVTKEVKIAVLKEVQNSMLAQFKFAKSVETNATCDDRLKIESAKSTLQQLHEDLDKIIKWITAYEKD